MGTESKMQNILRLSQWHKPILPCELTAVVSGALVSGGCSPSGIGRPWAFIESTTYKQATFKLHQSDSFLPCILLSCRHHCVTVPSSVSYFSNDIV